MSSKVRREYTPIQFTDVEIKDNFWAPRVETNRTETIPFQYKQCEETGRIDGFKPDAVQIEEQKRAASDRTMESYDPNWTPEKATKKTRHMFHDSDVHKWLEAASYTLASHPDPKLEALLDETIDLIVSAQQPDGYLNTFFTFAEPQNRWANTRDWHELYTAGKLFEAATAYYRATGKRKLLDAAIRMADHIDTMFGPEEGKKKGYPGHQEVELALVKLYHVTGDEKYLKLSKYFLDERGKPNPHFYDEEAIARGEDPKDFWAKTYEYCQCHKPIREQTEVVGHAVRATYMFAGMADIAGECQDDTLLEACERLYKNLCLTRMYVTGGIGPSLKNEGFTFDYDLPNETAYAETCAAIGLIFWLHRMIQLDCDGKYADTMERAFYNGMLSGVSLDGKKFFYVNPLASVGSHHRQGWFGCACCPPNVARLMASLGTYIYSQSETDAVVHMYVQGNAKFEIGGKKIVLNQKTDYPWDEKVTINFDIDQPTKFGLKLRIPGWCKTATLTVNGEKVEITPNTTKGYVRVEREWTKDDVVELVLEMPVEKVSAHPTVRQDVSKVTLQRGPVVYCLEQTDNQADVFTVILPKDIEFKTQFEKDLLGGVVTVSAEALAADTSDWENTLYRSEPPKTKKVSIKAVPYYAWDNREPGAMVVWLHS